MVLNTKSGMRSPDRDCQGGQARLAVIGSKAVGKTALTVRYLTKRFIGEYQSDTDMIYRATMPVDGAKIALEILDLSSNLDEVVVPRETVAWAEAWLVVYSITSLESFRVCVRAVEAVTTACGGDQPNPPVLIMANKKDLEHIREVPEAEGRKLAEQYGCRFVEVSAAEMVSQVNESIDGLLRQVSQHKGQTSPRLRKLSVSKMFNQLINLSSGGSQDHRPAMPRISLRDRARKRGHIRHS
ncbi:ras-related and estrogen-regulated growth inhibitor-like protein isoform X1 [Portunus trituberculatus]|uniref:ras-related and estrogen-regulated growth inhibitor-like protein isoform X1 n=2 Tax=Portunus trituberculatus TaxID=210409 RepID=UPI001E1D1BD7|nr:ras-related and estrogen-regulated growth inhibitor-like protein isoform X1 [Portunus trituberculatus]